MNVFKLVKLFRFLAIILALVIIASQVGYLIPQSWWQGWNLSWGGAAQASRPGVSIQIAVGNAVPTATLGLPPVVPPPHTTTPVAGGVLTNAWNCEDHTNTVTDSKWYEQSNAQTIAVCADPGATGFGIMAHNGILTDATIVFGNYSDGSAMNITFMGAPGCVNSQLGCLYGVQTPVLPAYGQTTFGSMAMGWSIQLYPSHPEMGEQGVQIFLRLEFQPGFHGLEIYP